MRESAQPAVYEAADRWIAAALRSDDSLFTPGIPIWSAPVILISTGALLNIRTKASDPSTRNSATSSAGAPAETIQLAGELALSSLPAGGRHDG